MKKALLYITYGIVCSLLAVGIVFLISHPPRGSAILLSPPPTPRLWVVQVSGAVVNPEVYDLPAGSRVRDAVQAAGGLTAEAYASAVNLAALLEDGQSIVIPASASLEGPPTQRGNALVAVTESPSAHLTDIITAALEELEDLPEIGPVIAQSIIDYRTTNGPYELLRKS